ncbi:MAG: histidine kinase [Candidatus Promineifilaceae bacterium]|jgi:histidine kinase
MNRILEFIRRRLSHLRWQIVGSQLIVIVVVIIVLMLATRTIFLSILATSIEPLLIDLIESGGAVEDATTELMITFRNVVIFSILVAGVGAAIIGWGASLILSRIILNPLQRLNISSRRIVDGRYDERITPSATLELADVAQQFNQMAESLENIEKNRVSLIGNVSHELRTPLTALQGYVEGLQDGLFPGDEETWAIMGVELSRLKRLVADLQDLSRVEGGNVRLTPFDFPVMPLIEQIRSQLQSRLMTKSLSFTTDEETQNTSVYADHDRTSQILINLLGNSIRHTAEGGALLIHVGHDEEENQITISVTDNGDGIPADSIPFVFERFYRVDPSRSRKSGGSGIGLSISRQLARLMDGDLTAASDGPKHGSTFTLRLPMAQITRENDR